MEISRLKVGIDVPWVTSWSEEAVLGVAPCPTVDGRLAVRQADHAGFGRPQYSMNHHDRQRASVRRLLCPMCGAPTPQDDRWTLTGKRTTAGGLRLRGLGFSVPPDLPDERVVFDAGAIAPGHRRCLSRAYKACPHLRADPAAILRRFPAIGYVSPLLIAATLEPNGAAPIDPTPVVTFLQLCGLTRQTDPDWRAKATLNTKISGQYQ